MPNDQNVFDDLCLHAENATKLLHAAREVAETFPTELDQYERQALALAALAISIEHTHTPTTPNQSAPTPQVRIGRPRHQKPPTHNGSEPNQTDITTPTQAPPTPKQHPATSPTPPDPAKRPEPSPDVEPKTYGIVSRARTELQQQLNLNTSPADTEHSHTAQDPQTAAAIEALRTRQNLNRPA